MPHTDDFRRRQLERSLRAYRQRRRAERIGAAAAIAMVLFVIAFWGAVAYVAIHFIAKWW